MSGTLSIAVRRESPQQSASAAPSRRALAAWLLGHSCSLLPTLGASVIARILGGVLHVVILVLIARGILAASTGTDVQFVQFGLTLVVLSLVKAVLNYLEHYTGHWVAFTALQRLRELFFTRLAPQAPAATAGRASAELRERATRDIDRIEVFFAHTFPPVIASFVVPVAVLTWVATTISPLLAGITALFLGAALMLPFLGARVGRCAAAQAAAHRGDLATHVADDVQGSREILAFEAGPRRLASLSAIEYALGATMRRLGTLVGVRLAIERLLWGGLLVTLLVVGFTHGDSSYGAISVADTVTVITVVVALWFGNAGSDDFATGLDAAFASCARVFRVVEADPVVRDVTPPRLIPAGPLTVELDRVTFAYPGADAPTLRGVSATFASGCWHTIVGVSGSGKSTIAAMLLRAWDPEQGALRLDGIPISEVPREALRKAVAVVDQRPFLFAGSLASNLRLACPDATDEELIGALRQACLDPDDLPDGLATTVGERGTTLSGGQVQRIALARALLAQPRVLVLDEALSQIDEETAEAIQIGLRRFLREGTIIEITHRVDLIPDERHVVVMDQGRVVEDGDARELRGRSGPLTHLDARL